IESKADGFLFENVPSIRHPRNRPLFEWVLKTANHAGYALAHAVVNAAEYGVAQLRQRVVVMGSRYGSPVLPRPTHSVEAVHGHSLRPVVTAGEVLEEYASDEYFEAEEVVQGRWAEHLREVPPGWNYKAHTAWAGHPHPTFETETRFWSF